MNRRNGFVGTAFLLFFAAFAGTPRLAKSQDIQPSARPHVVETSPTLEQRFVRPGDAVLTARFDMPMRTTSWSWCGGGPRYPEITGQPGFSDEHTAFLPVRLKPQHTYMLIINCPSGNNFVSSEGVGAEPYQLRFTTGSDPASPAQADSRNYAAWKEFRSLFREHYSYYDRLGIDWEKVFDEARAWMLESPDGEEFAVRLATMLARAEDIHLYLRLQNDEKVAFYRRRATYNANEQAIRAALGNWSEPSKNVWSGRAGEIGYLAIHSWSLEDAELDAIDKLIADFATTTKALIIDVRGNGGGIETQGRRVAGWFLDATRPYATNRTRDPEFPEGWSPVHTRWVQANPPEKRYPGRVLVLQGPVCLSSNEAFLEMMRQSPRSVSIGETSGGSSGNPKSFELRNGVTAVLPRWQSMTLDGRMTEGVGIPPDIEVKGDFRTQDPVLEKAFEKAREVTEKKGS